MILVSDETKRDLEVTFTESNPSVYSFQLNLDLILFKFRFS